MTEKDMIHWSASAFGPLAAAFEARSISASACHFVAPLRLLHPRRTLATLTNGAAVLQELLEGLLAADELCSFLRLALDRLCERELRA